MRIKYGNLLSQNMTGQVIAHGCNMQGVMGAGFAAQLAIKYPSAYQDYKKYYWNYKLGDVQLFLTKDGVYIANCFTQENYGTHKQQLSYEALDKCFARLSKLFYGERKVNFPLIGGGLAGGNKDKIIEIIKRHYPGEWGYLWLLEENNIVS